MKRGDIVVCIDDSDHAKRQSLTYGRGYKVEIYTENISDINKIVDYQVKTISIHIKNDKGIIGSYNANRFITICEWREMRLNEIGIV